jgi:hypothetical protein
MIVDTIVLVVHLQYAWSILENSYSNTVLRVQGIRSISLPFFLFSSSYCIMHHQSSIGVRCHCSSKFISVLIICSVLQYSSTVVDSYKYYSEYSSMCTVQYEALTRSPIFSGNTLMNWISLVELYSYASSVRFCVSFH